MYAINELLDNIDMIDDNLLFDLIVNDRANNIAHDQAIRDMLSDIETSRLYIDPGESV